jgi:nucleotide-binding universal stress UspA family protein
MLQKYRSKAVRSGLTNVDILEAPADDAANEILRIADKENIDTIMVGSRGLEAPKDFLLGSVSYKIGHYSKCPVIIVT